MKNKPKQIVLAVTLGADKEGEALLEKIRAVAKDEGMTAATWMRVMAIKKLKKASELPF